MSIAKILLILAIVAILALALIIYSLSPTIKTYSNHPTLKSLIGKELEVKTEAYIKHVEEGQYVFTPWILTPQSDYPGSRVVKLSVGDKIVIEEFKTHRNNLGAGITRLYALGRFTGEGRVTEFEYALTTVNDQNDEIVIPQTIWQHYDDAQMILSNFK